MLYPSVHIQRAPPPAHSTHTQTSTVENGCISRFRMKPSTDKWWCCEWKISRMQTNFIYFHIFAVSLLLLLPIEFRRIAPSQQQTIFRWRQRVRERVNALGTCLRICLCSLSICAHSIWKRFTCTAHHIAGWLAGQRDTARTQNSIVENYVNKNTSQTMRCFVNSFVFVVYRVLCCIASGQPI